MTPEWLEQGKEKSEAIVFVGSPQNPARGNETTKWKRFCEWLCPWLNRKRELGDEFLEARVLNEKATAMVKLAEAQERLANARKTAAEAAEISARLDQEKAKGIEPSASNNSAQVVQHLEELEAKLEQYRLQYGLRILRVESGTSQIESGAKTENKVDEPS